MGRKHCGKRRKCWLPAFSPFPTMFSKGFFFRVLKSPDRVVKNDYLTLYHTIQSFHAPKKEVRKFTEKEGNASNQLFSPFSEIFTISPKSSLNLKSNIVLCYNDFSSMLGQKIVHVLFFNVLKVTFAYSFQEIESAD